MSRRQDHYEQHNNNSQEINSQETRLKTYPLDLIWYFNFDVIIEARKTFVFGLVWSLSLDIIMDERIVRQLLL